MSITLKKLKKKRERLKLTGEIVARKAEISLATYWNAEAGKSIHPLTAKAIAGALGLTVEDLQ